MAAGLPMDKKKKVPELDYGAVSVPSSKQLPLSLPQLTTPSARFHQRRTSHSNCTSAPRPRRVARRALSIAISEGAHSPAILDSSVDARHSLNVQARKKFLSCVARRAVLSVSNVCPDPSSFLAWPQSHAL
jgi:hypothetical protein